MKFVVGKTYSWLDSGYDPITVISRTEKTIRVTNGHSPWRMRIKIDDDGNEYVIDSSVPKSYYLQFTCKATWEAT